MMTPAAARAAILITEILTFLLGTVLLAYFVSYAAALELDPGSAPPPDFPVVVHAGEAGKTGSGSYRVMPWREWEKLAQSRPGATLLLPERSARIALGDGAEASFKSVPESASRQAVELRWRSGNGEQEARYVARERTIEPRYLRTLSGDNILTSAIAAFLLSFFLGRALRRHWLERPHFFPGARR